MKKYSKTRKYKSRKFKKSYKKKSRKSRHLGQPRVRTKTFYGKRKPARELCWDIVTPNAVGMQTIANATPANRVTTLNFGPDQFPLPQAIGTYGVRYGDQIRLKGIDLNFEIVPNTNFTSVTAAYVPDPRDAFRRYRVVVIATQTLDQLDTEIMGEFYNAPNVNYINGYVNPKFGKVLYDKSFYASVGQPGPVGINVGSAAYTDYFQNIASGLKRRRFAFKIPLKGVLSVNPTTNAVEYPRRFKCYLFCDQSLSDLTTRTANVSHWAIINIYYRLWYTQLS